jgi:hypothetical protein
MPLMRLILRDSLATHPLPALSAIGGYGQKGRNGVVIAARLRRLGLLAALTPALSACVASHQTPSVNIVGAYFPSWLICAAAGIVISGAARGLFGRLGIDAHLPLRLLSYLSIAILSALLIWFLRFEGRLPWA